MTTTSLYNFAAAGGYDPSGGLFMDASGNLIGVASDGGTNGNGTVFEIAKTASGYASQPVTIADFGSLGNFVSPQGFLIADAQGDLFGLTQGGGDNEGGTVFEIRKTATGYASTPTLLVSSFGDATGFLPAGPLAMDAAGDLFGTTQAGAGGVFEITKTATGYAGTPTILATSAAITAGAWALSPLTLDSAGDLLGVSGGQNAAVVFEIAKTASGYASTPTILATLSGVAGVSIPTALAMDAAGDLFGATYDGTIFEMVKTASGYVDTPLTLATISGYYFNSVSTTLTLDPNGDIFGTSSSAGAGNAGVVFEIAKTASGYASTPTILHTFSGARGNARERRRDSGPGRRSGRHGLARDRRDRGIDLRAGDNAGRL